MKKKIVIIGSAGNFGKYISKELKKKNIVIGVQRNQNDNNYGCADLSNLKLNLQTFRKIKKKILVLMH